jgi:hypothetical protein
MLTEEKRNTCSVLVGKQRGKKPREKLKLRLDKQFYIWPGVE